MANLGQYASRTLTVGVITALVFGVAGMAAYSIAHKLVPPSDPLWEDVRCAIGIPSQGNQKCAQDAQRRLQSELNTTIQRSRAIETRLADELRAAELARGSAETALSGQGMVFTSGSRHKGKTIVVGVLFKDSATQQGLLRAWCWAIEDQGGLDPRVGLGRLEADGRVLPLDPGTEQSRFGWNDADLIAARGLCPWPSARS